MLTSQPLPPVLSRPRLWQSSGVLIREATTRDWNEIWPFWHRIAVAAETYSWEPTTGPDEARESWMIPPPGRVYVVQDVTTIVGSAQLRPNYGPASRVANASFIVDPDHAGRGIGRALVQHVIDEARSHGFRSMVFNAVVETNHNAVHLYVSQGFTILATVPAGFEHPQEGPVGVHIMYLKL
jgi:ribosomal protein S18 acetylase RimI-like enzyme